MSNLISNSKSYLDLLGRLREQIRTAQVKAALAVNRELILLYWDIGKQILERQNTEGWGKNVIPRLSKDLCREFPEMKGLSPRNLGYMKAFAEAWPDETILQQAAAKLPWFHNCIILDKIKPPEERLWYVRQAIEHGWSRNVLTTWIESGLYQRQGKGITNFQATLPKPQSDLAQQLIKDPYNFDFLTLGQEAHERDLERGLLVHIRQFLIELGVGFAFVGSQVPLQVGKEEFRIDLLFYHLKLRSFVVIDLKMTSFKPEYAGKMNFYLSAVDDMLRHPGDNPSIGLILCKGKEGLVAEYALRDINKPLILCKGKEGLVAEYALRDINKPLGISEFRHLEKLPEQLKGTLPTIEEIEAELAAAEE